MLFEKILSREIVEFALVVDDVCQGCRFGDSRECALCDRRLQARLEELDLA